MPGTIAVGMCFNPSRPWNPEDGCIEISLIDFEYSRKQRPTPKLLV